MVVVQDLRDNENMRCRRLIAALVLSLGFDALAAPSTADVRELMAAGKLEAARAALEEHLAVDATDPNARFLSGLVLARLERRDEAIEVFKGLVRDYPELPEPHNNLAVLYAADGRYEEARDALLRAIGTHPSYATAHENLGDIYARMAASAYDKALTLDADNASAGSKLALVNELLPATRGVPVSAGPTNTSATPPSSTSGPRAEEILAATYGWATAWSARDVAAYLDAYAADFEPGEGVSRQRWEAQRRRRVAGPAFIEVNVEDPEVTFRGDGRAAVSFLQSYRSDRYRDRVRKTLEFVREDGGWKIIRERAQDP